MRFSAGTVMLGFLKEHGLGYISYPSICLWNSLITAVMPEREDIYSRMIFSEIRFESVGTHDSRSDVSAKEMVQTVTVLFR